MKNKLFYLSSILLTIYLLIQLSPENGKLFISSLTISTIILACLMLDKYLKKNQSCQSRNYIKLLWLITTSMLCMALVYSLLGVGKYTLSTVVQDLMSVIVLSSGIIMTSKNLEQDQRNLTNFLIFLGIIALFAGLMSFVFADFSTGRKENVWKPQYIWWGLLYPWSFLLLYRFIMKKSNLLWNVLAFGTAVGYIVLGLLFQKRSVLYDLLIVILIIMIANRRSINIMKTMKLTLTFVCVIIPIMFGLMFVTNVESVIFELFEQTWDRVTNINISEFDRFVEFIDAFELYPLTILVTGAGLGAYHDGPGVINMHIGWLNYIFKGGILFVALQLWIMLKAALTLLYSKDNWRVYVSASVLFEFLRILITSSWVATPSTLLFSVFIFTLLNLQGAPQKESFQNGLKSQ